MPPENAKNIDRWHHQTDLLVVGFGCAGAAAALAVAVGGGLLVGRDLRGLVRLLRCSDRVLAVLRRGEAYVDALLRGNRRVIAASQPAASLERMPPASNQKAIDMLTRFQIMPPRKSIW